MKCVPKKFYNQYGWIFYKRTLPCFLYSAEHMANRQSNRAYYYKVNYRPSEFNYYKWPPF